MQVRGFDVAVIIPSPIEIPDGSQWRSKNLDDDDESDAASVQYSEDDSETLIYVFQNSANDKSRMGAERFNPFIIMIWSLTGAFYPAIDLCAGEKERGTFETLLSSPAARSEIAIGKLFTVISFSMATSILNLLSMAFTGMFVMSRIGSSMGGGLPLGAPPMGCIGWLLLALIPISALFSAVALAAAAFARSSKEGQYYLVPLMMISMPLMCFAD